LRAVEQPRFAAFFTALTRTPAAAASASKPSSHSAVPSVDPLSTTISSHGR